MHPQWTMSLPAEARVATDGRQSFAVRHRGRGLTWQRLTPAVRAGLEGLAYPGQPLAGLVADLQRSETPDAFARFLDCLHSLCGRGMLRMSVWHEQQLLATLEPTSYAFVLPREDLGEGRYVLSRFAYLHRAGKELVLETPLCAARVILHSQGVADVIHGLAVPATVAEMSLRQGHLPAGSLAPLMALLQSAELLSPVGEDDAVAEDEDPQLRSWEFHDLLFHARSREGRHDAPVGNTYRLAGVLDSPPTTKPVGSVATVDLVKPDAAELEARDPPFARVLEQRRSVREYAAEPMTVAQLGEFLFRVAAVRQRWEYDAYTPLGVVPLEATLRTYPSGGALYPLEIYPVVQACVLLEPGLYHYDPLDHRLSRLSGLTSDALGLVERAGAAAAIPGPAVQVLLVVTARFQRVAWKYSSLAYSLILKDLGGLMQSMYLAATAMGLAPCALGAGDSDRFARATGIDYYAEGSVGEFLLGRKKDPL